MVTKLVTREARARTGMFTDTMLLQAWGVLRENARRPCYCKVPRC